MGDAENTVEPVQSPVFIKGVVCEVLYDLGLFNDEKKVELSEKLTSEAAGLLPTAPRNTCLVRLIGSGRGQSLEQVVAYPFFPPHLSFPVKPGEIVWIFSPRPGTIDPEETYWVSRVSTSVTMDDVNYAAQTRGGEPQVPPTAGGKTTGWFLPGFPNKARNNDKLLNQSKEDDEAALDPLQNIVDLSESYKNFSPETRS